MKKLKGLLKYLCRVVVLTLLTIVVIFGLALLFIFVTTKVAQSQGKTPPINLYTIISPSMTPTINVYDVVVSVQTKPENLKVMDIITFNSDNPNLGGISITHRIVQISNSLGHYKFTTKGDYNKAVDAEEVSQSDVIGKVIFKIPQLGRVQFFLASKGGWIIAILIPALGVIAYDIYKIIKLILIKKKIIGFESEEDIKNNKKDLVTINDIYKDEEEYRKQQEVKKNVEEKPKKKFKLFGKKEKLPDVMPPVEAIPTTISNELPTMEQPVPPMPAEIPTKETINNTIETNVAEKQDEKPKKKFKLFGKKEKLPEEPKVEETQVIPTEEEALKEVEAQPNNAETVISELKKEIPVTGKVETPEVNMELPKEYEMAPVEEPIREETAKEVEVQLNNAETVIPELNKELPVTEKIQTPEVNMELPKEYEMAPVEEPIKEETPKEVEVQSNNAETVIPELEKEIPVTEKIQTPEVNMELPKEYEMAPVEEPNKKETVKEVEVQLNNAETVIPELKKETPVTEEIQVPEVNMELPKEYEMAPVEEPIKEEGAPQLIDIELALSGLKKEAPATQEVQTPVEEPISQITNPTEEDINNIIENTQELSTISQFDKDNESDANPTEEVVEIINIED